MIDEDKAGEELKGWGDCWTRNNTAFRAVWTHFGISLCAKSAMHEHVLKRRPGGVQWHEACLHHRTYTFPCLLD